MPSGGSRNGAWPRPPRKSAAATSPTPSRTLALTAPRRRGARDRAARAAGLVGDRSSALDADHDGSGETLEQVVDGAVHVAPILGLERHLDLVLGVEELRVRAQHEVGVPAEQLVQVLGERALRHVEEDAAE